MEKLSNSKCKNSNFNILLAVGILLQVSIIILIQFIPMKFWILFPFFILLCIYIFSGNNLIEKFTLITLVVAGILPHLGRRLFLRIEEVPFFIALFLWVLWAIYVRPQLQIGKIGYALAWFLGIIFLAGIWGLLSGNSPGHVLSELFVFNYFLLYFIVVTINPSRKWRKIFIYSIIFTAAIVGIQYIMRSKILYGRFIRAATDQQHIFNLAVPLAFCGVIYEKGLKKKIMLILSLIFMSIGVIVSFTRMLWVSVFFSLLLVAMLYPMQKVRPIKPILPLLLIVIGGILLWFVGMKYFSELVKFFLVRARTLGFLKFDISYWQRVELAQYTLEMWEKLPILGCGLGSFVEYVKYGKGTIYLLDNTYLQLLWKTGVLGLLAFIVVLYLFLKRTWFVLRYTKDAQAGWISLAVFTAFIPMLILGWGSSLLIGYRLNFFWAVSMAFIELMAQEQEKSG